MVKIKIREAVVVEGKYDRNTLSQIVDAPIFTLNGFGVFHDRAKLALLRRVASERGLIVLTDSDGAGFVLRGFLKGAVPKERVKHAYIPEIAGKERRKRRPGKAGKLGVEGMRPEVLKEALRRAGATFEDAAAGTPQPAGAPVTKADLYAWGLTGGADSAARRRALCRRLDLPEGLNANALLEALNLLYSREALEALLDSPEQAVPD